MNILNSEINLNNT